LAVADQGSIPRGTLSIGANEATCLYVLPDVFAKFSSLYPGVQISIYRNFSYKIVEKLENGALDVGIVTLPVKSSSLKTHSIYRDQLMVMVSPQNPLAKHDVVSVADVAKQPLLLPKTGYSRRLMDKLFRPYAAQLQIRMELPSVGMIKSFVAAGLGVSLISASFARDQVLAGRVKLIGLQDEELWRELGVAYRRDRTLTRATSTFISTVRQLAATK
jgi:DNA-binding transcriptional LysR family regulator